jgi:hypothetical protein
VHDLGRTIAPPGGQASPELSQVRQELSAVQKPFRTCGEVLHDYPRGECRAAFERRRAPGVDSDLIAQPAQFEGESGQPGGKVRCDHGDSQREVSDLRRRNGE